MGTRLVGIQPESAPAGPPSIEVQPAEVPGRKVTCERGSQITRPQRNGPWIPER